MLEQLLAHDGFIVYIMLFLALMAGAIGLPIPEDIPLVVAGIMAQKGSGKIEVLFLICYTAIILGDLLIYSVGRRFGPALFNKPWFKARVSKQKIKRIKKGIEKRSLLMIFLARHLFYLRTVTFLVSGAVRVHFRKFLIADAAAALISVPLMMWIGYAGAEHFEDIGSSVKKIEQVAILIGVILLLIAAYVYFKRTYFHKEDTDEDMAIIIPEDDQEKPL